MHSLKCERTLKWCPDKHKHIDRAKHHNATMRALLSQRVPKSPGRTPPITHHVGINGHILITHHRLQEGEHKRNRRCSISHYLHYPRNKARQEWREEKNCRAEATAPPLLRAATGTEAEGGRRLRSSTGDWAQNTNTGGGPAGPLPSHLLYTQSPPTACSRLL